MYKNEKIEKFFKICNKDLETFIEMDDFLNFNLKDKSMDDILVKKFFSKTKTVIQKISERIKSWICLLSLWKFW